MGARRPAAPGDGADAIGTEDADHQANGRVPVPRLSGSSQVGQPLGPLVPLRAAARHGQAFHLLALGETAMRGTGCPHAAHPALLWGGDR